jgi:hypothetical protein
MRVCLTHSPLTRALVPGEGLSWLVGCPCSQHLNARKKCAKTAKNARKTREKVEAQKKRALLAVFKSTVVRVVVRDKSSQPQSSTLPADPPRYPPPHPNLLPLPSAGTRRPTHHCPRPLVGPPGYRSRCQCCLSALTVRGVCADTRGVRSNTNVRR